ncbi:MAG: hypothetical protein H6753_00965 [Candidatus Omnitrophica bacterium]|nr:hypothetical protein [Candidatus Omnitrophota bacterium]
MPREEQVNVRLTKEEKKQIQKDAEDQGRTVSNLLLWCWKEWQKSKVKK